MIIILSKDDSEVELNKKRKKIQEMLDSNPKLAASYKSGADGSTEVEINESVDFEL